MKEEVDCERERGGGGGGGGGLVMRFLLRGMEQLHYRRGRQAGVRDQRIIIIIMRSIRRLMIYLPNAE